MNKLQNKDNGYPAYMQVINIVVPTRNRWEKLVRLIKSIDMDSWTRLHIICDDDLETYQKLKAYDDNNIMPIHNWRHEGAVACRNKIIKNIKHGGVLYATDDITFVPGAIKTVREIFNHVFPDGDGVVGLRQDRSHNPVGVALLDQKFLNRYPNRILFNPEYYHFACQEVHWLATKVDRFHHTEEVLLKHFHPAFIKNEMDQTHIDARIKRTEDLQLIERRNKEGLIWGMKNQG